MTATRDRQRAAARAKLEREAALRAEQARKRRQRASYLGVGAAVLVVLVAVVWIIVATTGGKKSTPTATPSSTQDANAGICLWAPNPAPSASGPANPHLKKTGTPPSQGLPHSGTETMTVKTNQGDITISLDLANAPCAAASFKFLADKGYFNNSTCHRLTKGQFYVLQCGDPTGTGSGGPSYTFGDENLPSGKRPTYVAGDVAMANPGQPNQNGSQFFIVYKDTPDGQDNGSGQPSSTLQANYSVIGSVTSGLNVVDKIAAGGIVAGQGGADDGKPKLPVTISTITVSGPQATPATS